MENFNKSSEYGKNLIFKYIKGRMKEKSISETKLAEMIDINRTTLSRNFQGHSEMLLSTYLKICGALELRPYLIPKEMDENEMKQIFFN